MLHSGRLAVLFACAAILILSRASSAQFKSDPFSGDPRLERPVTLHAEGISLGELLPRVGKTTGVALTADRDVSDDRVILLGPDRPLRDVLADVATLLGCVWAPASNGAGRSYRLTRDPAVRKLERELESAPERQLLGQMDAQVRALKETPGQLERRPEGDPVRKYLLDPKARFATSLYALLNPEQRRSLIDRGHFRIFFGALPPPHQQAILDVWKRQQEEAERNATIIRGRFGVTYQRKAPPDVELSLVRAQFVDGKPSGGRVFLRMYPEGIVFASLEETVRFPPPRGNPYTGDGIRAGSPLPKEVPAPDAERDWTDQLRDLAEKNGIPVVADHSRLRLQDRSNRTPPVGSPAGVVDPAAALDRMCRPDGALWWMQGSTLFFRKRDWFLRRFYEVPDRWLDRTTRALQARNEQPTLGDLLRLRELTRRQQAGLQGLGVRFGALPGAFSWYEDRHLGLLELLSVVGGRAPSAALNQVRILNPRAQETSEASNRAYETMTIRYEQLRPDQRARVVPFLAAQRKQLDGLNPETFSTTIVAGEPTSHKRTHRYVPIEINWRTKGGQGDFDYVFLPLTIPNDRRDRTVVRLPGEPPAGTPGGEKARE